MRPLVAGAVAGWMASLAHTATMAAAHRLLPGSQRYPIPPFEITEAVQGGRLPGPGQEATTSLLHYGYGAAAGAAYGVAAPHLPGGAGPASAIAWGLAVWGVSYLGWLPAAGILTPATRHPPRRTAMMIAAHIAWGAALGMLTRRLAAPSES